MPRVLLPDVPFTFSSDDDAQEFMDPAGKKWTVGKLASGPFTLSVVRDPEARWLRYASGLEAACALAKLTALGCAAASGVAAASRSWTAASILVAFLGLVALGAILYLALIPTALIALDREAGTLAGPDGRVLPASVREFLPRRRVASCPGFSCREGRSSWRARRAPASD